MPFGSTARQRPGRRRRRAGPRHRRAPPAPGRRLRRQARRAPGRPAVGPALLTDDGWDWGSNGRILNNLVVLAVVHEITGQGSYFAAVCEGWTTCRCHELGRAASPAMAPTPSLAGAPPLRTRPRPGIPTATARRSHRGPASKRYRAFTPVPGLEPPTAPMPLPRRADIRNHQRRVHPLERSARVHIRLAHTMTYPSGAEDSRRLLHSVVGLAGVTGHVGPSLWTRCSDARASWSVTFSPPSM